MNSTLRLLLVAVSLLTLSIQALAQRTVRVDERIQTTYRNTSMINVANWLRVYPGDAFQTEVRNMAIRGNSYVNNGGAIEVYASGRMIARLAFGRITTQINVNFPLSTRVSDISLRVTGEVFVERVSATIVERYWQPVPPPLPPRPIPIPPRPAPPRHEPAPRPRPPRHEPAPRPRPPRHEPAPRPTPPRYETPRPRLPRHEPAPRPRPGTPRPGGPGRR